MPKSIIEGPKKLRRRFLWGGLEENNKVNWVAWKTVLSPKDKGGLGVGSLLLLNLALLVKWIWRFKSDPLVLWCNMVSGVHN